MPKKKSDNGPWWYDRFRKRLLFCGLDWNSFLYVSFLVFMWSDFDRSICIICLFVFTFSVKAPNVKKVIERGRENNKGFRCLTWDWDFYVCLQWIEVILTASWSDECLWWFSVEQAQGVRFSTLFLPFGNWFEWETKNYSMFKISWWMKCLFTQRLNGDACLSWTRFLFVSFFFFVFTASHFELQKSNQKDVCLWSLLFQSSIESFMRS